MSRRNRLGAWLWALVVIVAAGLGFVGGRWAFTAPRVDDAASAPATVVVDELTVGRSIPTMVAASWIAQPFGVGAASGVLTSLLVGDGDTVDAGSVLYTVGLRPVAAAVGSVPAFRDLTMGATGADVTQLQRLLIDKGLLKAADGKFGATTQTAILVWQKTLGVKADGIVRAGDVVYAAKLPARVRLADGIAVGQRLTPGDVVFSVLEPDPQFTVTVLPGSPLDAANPLEVMFNNQAVVVSATQDMSGNMILVLTSADGSPICAARCDQVPLDPARAVYAARQVVTPETTGPVVPAAAVWLTTAGDPYLVTPDGTQLAVTIVAAGQGSVVLGGVADGTLVTLAGSVFVGDAVCARTDGDAVMTCLVAQRLSFTYRRDTAPVIDGLDFAAPTGAVTALTGASGSGKSTLLYLLALLIRPTSGDVIWDGQVTGGLPDAARSRLRAARMGFVFQDALLDASRTVLANVCDSGLFVA